MTLSTVQQVEVFTRRIEGDGRRISFRVPDSPLLSSFDLLESGFAIDGNSAIADIWFDNQADDSGMFLGPFDVCAKSMTAALQESQLNLVKLLQSRGFEVVLK